MFHYSTPRGHYIEASANKQLAFKACLKRIGRLVYWLGSPRGLHSSVLLTQVAFGARVKTALISGLNWVLRLDG